MGRQPASTRPKEILAYELTKLVHGEEEANHAKTASKALFAGGSDDTHMPTTKLEESQLTDGSIGILELYVGSEAYWHEERSEKAGAARRRHYQRHRESNPGHQDHQRAAYGRCEDQEGQESIS